MSIFYGYLFLLCSYTYFLIPSLYYHFQSVAPKVRDREGGCRIITIGRDLEIKRLGVFGLDGRCGLM